MSAVVEYIVCASCRHQFVSAPAIMAAPDGWVCPTCRNREVEVEGSDPAGVALGGDAPAGSEYPNISDDPVYRRRAHVSAIRTMTSHLRSEVGASPVPMTEVEAGVLRLLDQAADLLDEVDTA